MKTKKRTSGSSSLRLILAFAVLSAGLPAQKRKVEPFALLAGTVFRDTGFSLPGAELNVAPAPDLQPPPKFKRIKVVSDARGEFAIRLPAHPMRYNVSVQAKGYRSASKEVAIQGEERVELFFRLEPESQ